MTREEIINMAESVGCGSIPKSNGVFIPAQNIEQFAARVATHEREECAKICDYYSEDTRDNFADLCAYKIRARGMK